MGAILIIAIIKYGKIYHVGENENYIYFKYTRTTQLYLDLLLIQITNHKLKYFETY